jgi:hypothetical protein
VKWHVHVRLKSLSILRSWLVRAYDDGEVLAACRSNILQVLVLATAEFHERKNPRRPAQDRARVVRKYVVEKDESGLRS